MDVLLDTKHRITHSSLYCHHHHYLACRRRRKAGETRCANVSIIKSSSLPVPGLPAGGKGKQVRQGVLRRASSHHYLACRRYRKAGETRCAKVSIKSSIPGLHEAEEGR